MTRGRAPALVAVLLLLLAQGARAQAPGARLARGIRAYQNLDYDSAAVLLRAALSQPGSPPLGDSGLARALTYLGATEIFRGHRDSAVAVFAQLLNLNPRYRIDQLVFPPDVTNVFQQVRLTTRAVAVVVPPTTPIAAPGDRLVIWLYAASYHPATVTISGQDRGELRTLYDGGLSDSLQLLWDARAPDGSPLDTGRYQLRVDSRGDDGRVVRSVAVNLDLTLAGVDTLPLPPPPAESLFKPEYAPGASGVRGLLTGLAAAVVVIALPSIVAGHGGTADRFAVAAALGVAGGLAMPFQRRSRAIVDNIAANDALRRAWRQQADSVHAANVALRRGAQLLIKAGPPRVVAGP